MKRGIPKTQKELTFYVYEVIANPNTPIVTANTLTSNYLLHDAHASQEHCVLGKCKMMLKHKVVAFNTMYFPKSYSLEVVPFNDSRYRKYRSYYPPLHIAQMTDVKPSRVSTVVRSFKELLRIQTNSLESFQSHSSQDTSIMKATPLTPITPERVLKTISQEAINNPLSTLPIEVTSNLSMVINGFTDSAANTVVTKRHCCVNLFRCKQYLSFKSKKSY